MPTWSRLYYQRLRWQRGALDNLRAYGLTRVTLPYVCRQALTYLSVAFVPFFLTVLLYYTFTKKLPGLPWFWIALTGIAAFERVWAAKRGGWKALLLTVTIVPEVLFAQFLNVVYAKALIDLLTRTDAAWEQTRGRKKRLRKLLVTTCGLVLLLAGAVGLAFACITLGIAWHLIAVFVLCGVAAAACTPSDCCCPCPAENQSTTRCHPGANQGRQPRQRPAPVATVLPSGEAGDVPAGIVGQRDHCRDAFADRLRAHLVGLADGEGDLQTVPPDAPRVGCGDVRQEGIAVPHRHPHRALTDLQVEHDRARRVLDRVGDQLTDHQLRHPHRPLRHRQPVHRLHLGEEAGGQMPRVTDTGGVAVKGGRRRQHIAVLGRLSLIPRGLPHAPGPVSHDQHTKCTMHPGTLHHSP
jgi:hypothetical protein